jgi:hypothetical protein
VVRTAYTSRPKLKRCAGLIASRALVAAMFMWVTYDIRQVWEEGEQARSEAQDAKERAEEAKEAVESLAAGMSLR